MSIAAILAKSFGLYNNSKSHTEYLDACHRTFQQPIYDLLSSNYLEKLRAWWKTYTLPLATETNKGIVLYETRKDPNLEFLMYNLAYFAKGYGLIIFCSFANHSYITNILGKNKYRCILHVVREDEGGVSVRETYNEFVKSAEFWHSLPFEYVLMAEIDSYLRKPLPKEIETYDYVCCEWPWNKSMCGGGGVSFRKVATMKRIVQEFPTLCTETFPQDCWASAGSKKLEASYNNSYFVEANHSVLDPIGFHQWWTFINPSNLPQMLPVYEKYVTLEL
jgi:hypothetical protein